MHTQLIKYDHHEVLSHVTAKCCISSSDMVNDVWRGSMNGFQCVHCEHRDADENYVFNWPIVCTIARMAASIASFLNIECSVTGMFVFMMFWYRLMVDVGSMILDSLRGATCGVSKCITANWYFFDLFPCAICLFVGLVSSWGNLVEYVVRDFVECLDVGVDFQTMVASS